MLGRSLINACCKNSHLMQRHTASLIIFQAFTVVTTFWNTNSPVLKMSSITNCQVRWEKRKQQEAEVKMWESGERRGCGGGGINGEQNSVWVWQPRELSDHSSKRLLWGLWLLEVEKLTGSKEARAQREGNGAYSEGSGQPASLIALHYLILI